MHRGAVFFHLVGGGPGDSGVRVAHNFGVRRARGVGGDHDSRGFRVAFRHQVQVPISSITDLDTGMRQFSLPPVPPRYHPGGRAAPGAAEGETVIPRIRPCVSHRRLRTLTARRSRIGTSRCCRPTLTGSTVTTTASD
jgi:hypothetical protein